MTENTMGTIAISDATIGAVNEKAINCQGMFKSLVDATSGITGPPGWPPWMPHRFHCRGGGIWNIRPLRPGQIRTPRRAHLWRGALRGEYGSARRGEQPLIGGQENRCR